MKTLELEPLQKKLSVIVVEKEYDESLWEYDYILLPRPSPPPKVIKRPSVAFREFLWEIITKFKPDFVTEELGIRKEKDFFEKNPVAQACNERDIRYYLVDIDENAKLYLANIIEERKDRRDEVLQLLARLSKEEGGDGKIEYLTAYGQYLQYELEEEIKRVSSEIRESWISMGILGYAKETDKDVVVSIHICSPRHIEGITKLLKSLDVEVIPVKLEKSCANARN